MIPELGHFALALALAVSLFQAIVPMMGAARHDRLMMAMAPVAALAQAIAIAVAAAALVWSHVVSDFTVINVVENSHSAKPLLYKIAGTWGNHEGSMVLWVLILALFGAAVAILGGRLPTTLRARVLSVQAMIGAAFLLFILATSNPFGRLVSPPPDGRDLNPLLQDPGLAFHPPMLYLGYVGFSLTFSFAIAALLEGRVDAAWARWVRPWTLAAWTCLTAGIALGSWWAYYELGWGGWWFWDPVENASLMPWLSGTALLHSAIVVEKRDALRSWTILLAIVTFSLSLMGTFLVRSGVLTSVHAFAVDPSRGLFILVLIVGATGGSLALYAWKASGLQPGGLFGPISREGALVLNNLLLATGTVTVLIGTLYPLFLDALGKDKVTVGPPFFNTTFVPIMILLVVLMGIGPLLPWKRADLGSVLLRLRVAALTAVVIAAVAAWMHGLRPIVAIVALAAGSWAVVLALAEPLRRIQLLRVSLGESLRRARGLPAGAWGMMLAHAGVGVMIFGMVGASLWVTETLTAMRPGDTVTISRYTLYFDREEPVRGANYTATRGVFTLIEHGQTVATLAPEQRRFNVSGTVTAETAIRTGWRDDVYLALGDRQETGAWVVRAYVHPLVAMLWGGPLLLVVGGVLSLYDRRFRVGAPARRPVPAAVFSA